MADGTIEQGRISDETSSTLLVRIKAKDQEAWQRFVHLYGPLVYCWCRQFGVEEADAHGVMQDVFRRVSEAIAGYHHEQKGNTFRGWLRSLTRTRVLEFLRQEARGAQAVGGSGTQPEWLELPDGQADSGSTEDEDELILIRQAVAMVLDNVQEENRQAFLRVVIAGNHPSDVAQDLGMTVNAVYVAKSHILRRIRQEFAEFVEL